MHSLRRWCDLLHKQMIMWGMVQVSSVLLLVQK